MSMRLLLSTASCAMLLLLAPSAQAFTPTFVSNKPRINAVRLNAATVSIQERRKTLLSRKGPFFNLESSDGAIEFGATANLVTQLEEGGDDSNENSAAYIQEWLSDEQRVATSIWDPDLISMKGDYVYQLKVMKLQFVTLQLQPSVDIKMWTKNSVAKGVPIFYIQSVGFEPNIQVLPGLKVDGKALGIEIEVVGQLAPTPDGKGVSGKIAFSTSGNLPGPLRILPEGALRAASDSINNTITQFAIASFEKGAISKYREFRAMKMLQEKQQL